jgi:hypothetical protein
MSQYILYLLIFVVNNRDQFLLNLEIHNTNTRHNSILCLCVANLHTYQRGVYYSGIMDFNSLPFNITKFSDNPRTFKSPLKNLDIEFLSFIR